MQLILVVLNKPDRDFRVGQGDLFDQVRHMGALGHRCFQKFPADWCVVKEIAHDKRSPVRRSDLFHAALHTALYLITVSG